MLTLLHSDITEQCTLKALNIFTLTSCSYTHTHANTSKSLERAEVKRSDFDYYRLFPPLFHVFISLLLHGWCQRWCRCLSRLVQRSVAESLIKMAWANRIVSQSNTQPSSLCNVLSNHCDGQLGLCEGTINIL